jgi:maleate isomerase
MPRWALPVPTSGVPDNSSFGAVDEETIGRMIADCLPAAPDAITILCTNMIGARVAADMETPDGRRCSTPSR